MWIFRITKREQNWEMICVMTNVAVCVVKWFVCERFAPAKMEVVILTRFEDIFTAKLCESLLMIWCVVFIVLFARVFWDFFFSKIPNRNKLQH